MPVILLILFYSGAHAETTGKMVASGTTSRIASIHVSQDFINEQLALHSKSTLVTNLKIELDPIHSQLFLHGEIQVPLEELRAINLDPKLGRFRFQLALKIETTPEGYLILNFPLNETYFYSLDSKNREHERVIIPVQMLSIALASARGYLAAISGDFNGFDRKTKKLEALLKGVERSIALEKNEDALMDLRNEQISLKLKLEAIPVERSQLKSISKEVESMLGFTGEKEMNLNDTLAASQNSLILKVKLSQLVPYLKDTELAGVRILQDKKDGGHENFLSLDLSGKLAKPIPLLAHVPSPNRAGMKVAPSLVIRLNQALFESEAVISAEKSKMGSSIRDFDLQLKADGLHISGKWHKFFFNIPFDTVIDFVTTGPDVFEARLRKIDVAGIHFGFLASLALDALKERLNQSLKGICTFQYLGKEDDEARALQVKIDPAKMIPAFPSLHLVDVDIKEQEFILKIGKIE